MKHFDKRTLYDSIPNQYFIVNCIVSETKITGWPVSGRQVSRCYPLPGSGHSLLVELDALGSDPIRCPLYIPLYRSLVKT